MPLSWKRLHHRYRRSHDVGVCIPCRRRHVKCDFLHPSYSAYKAIGGNKARGLATPGPRKHLYTEEDRVSISMTLQSSLISGPICHSLEEIERTSKVVASLPGQRKFVGSLGVMELRTEQVDPPSSISVNADSDPTESSSDLGNSLSETLPGFINALDSTSPDPEIDNGAEHRGAADGAMILEGLPHTSPCIRRDLYLENITISDAQSTLAHFRYKVIPFMFSFPLYEKAPLEIVNTQSAVVTLANLSYMGVERVTHAALANLLALIAISARHFAATVKSAQSSDASHWKKVSEEAYSQARFHMEYSFTYKEQLMAISAMLGFAILFDYQKDARAYLVDSERLLSFRGLAKRVVSRNARLLHHIYTWNRTLIESSFVLRFSQDSEVETNLGWIRPPLNTRTNPSLELDEFLHLKDYSTDSSLNDIHLEGSREDTKAMYRQLYGVSETWLSLVSQTTRLANVVSKLNSGHGRLDGPLRETIERKRRWLEDMIWQLIGGNEYPTKEQPRKPPDITTKQPRSYMTRALNQGLLIYFY
ncbi:hypothetical protein ASPACDRAFT_55686 [Aspergillus aculeatus ATCC 16872]|uniref:Zn(2)-C6 fungal-type domain-containing protein n=1 Tax=Aspergillus aculeatus (strain ATCC 16872 / CBS 172.66 / WB 5094) TaxID=690307 RepID=A0A1L9WES7_ASPA1|nr:uncharacterized protein ASPACDRAFT_55686 [Aspergillus aculeatus ATCC 16872]OJJ94679.1 hypothetical protein ASPACDRAFT_55686 [Aspergillus aculeatus ATCC 16872]